MTTDINLSPDVVVLRLDVASDIVAKVRNTSPWIHFLTPVSLGFESGFESRP